MARIYEVPRSPSVALTWDMVFIVKQLLPKAGLFRGIRFMRQHLRSLLLLAGTCVTLSLVLGGVAGAQSAAPELDPSTTTSGVVLLVGGTLFLIERYRRRHR